MSEASSREESGDAAEEQEEQEGQEEQEETWEHSQRKHIFILSSSGKPIYSRYGDEQSMANTFGMIQAVISIAEEREGGISCIQAGHRRMVFFLRGSLYFVAISSTMEPQAVLGKQLEFMYRQVLLTLTSKVQTLLTTNSSRDLRDLLGADTTQLMSTACTFDIAPLCIAFESIKSFVADKETRSVVLSCLKESIDKTDAPCAMLMYEEHLIAYSLNGSIGIALEVSDILLLTHFVSNSSSLRRSNDQNWVPVCLPSFNEKAFLQAYVCNLRLMSGGRVADLSLVLLSTSAEPETFSQLHEARKEFERKISQAALSDRLVAACGLQDKHLARYLSSSSVLHFLHKYSPSTGGSPSQFCSAAFQFPLDSPLSRERVLTQYERLALYLRVGSSSPELTVPQEPGEPNVLCLPPSSDYSLAYSVLSTGLVVVGYATFNTECFATFPGTLTGMDCCKRIGSFVKELRQDLALFQA